MSLPRANRIKQWVCYVGTETTMQDNAQLWTDSQALNGENYEWLKRKTPFFSRILENDILMIYCHGAQNPPGLYLKNYGSFTDEEGKIPSEFPYSPQQFLDFLISHELNPNHKVLKLAACYTNEFAKELFDICEPHFPNLTIVGYPKQLVLGQGLSGGILAGLEEPLVKRQGRGWIINDEELDKIIDIEIYSAENKKSEFKPNDRLEKKADTTPLQNNPTSSSRPLTRSVARNSQTASIDMTDYTAIPSQTDSKIEPAVPSPRRDSTSSIMSLLNLNPLLQTPRSTVTGDIGTENPSSNIVEGKTPTQSNPLQNSRIANEPIDNQPNFDQPKKDDIIDIQVRRRTM